MTVIADAWRDAKTFETMVGAAAATEVTRYARHFRTVRARSATRMTGERDAGNSSKNAIIHA
jgi:hypothetical protein